MPCVVGIDASRAQSAAPTGTEGYSFHLIRALLPLFPAMGNDYRARLYFRRRVASDERPQPADLDGDAAYVERRFIPFPRLWTHFRLSWEMINCPPDLLFVPAHLLPLYPSRRTLVTIHDLGYRFFPEAHPWSQRFYLDWGTRRDARQATHLLVDSRATREALIREYQVPESKITVAYPGYDAALAPVTDPAALQAVRARYQIPGPYILYLGRIQPRKNLLRVVNAFAKVLPDQPDLTLVLAGPTGWMAEPILARVRELRLEQKVLFPGYIAEADKAALLSGALFFVFPSLYEGFGFPVLEAQACDTPVLTSMTSSLPEVAGKSAMLIDPLNEESIASCMAYLARDEAMRRYLIGRGRENLHRFSWQETAQVVADVIQRLTSNHQEHAK